MNETHLPPFRTDDISRSKEAAKEIQTSAQQKNTCGRLSIPEIARKLDVGRLTVYAMLEQGIIPGVRVGRRWIVTRHAFDHWEQTCGANSNGTPRPPKTVQAVQ